MEWPLTSVSPLKPRPQALRRLVGELDGHLQQRDGEEAVRLGGHPQAEAVVHAVRLSHRVHQLVQEVQAQVAVLQQSPAALQTDRRTMELLIELSEKPRPPFTSMAHARLG